VLRPELLVRLREPALPVQARLQAQPVFVRRQAGQIQVLLLPSIAVCDSVSCSSALFLQENLFWYDKQRIQPEIGEHRFTLSVTNCTGEALRLHELSGRTDCKLAAP